MVRFFNKRELKSNWCSACNWRESKTFRSFCDVRKLSNEKISTWHLIDIEKSFYREISWHQLFKFKFYKNRNDSQNPFALTFNFIALMVWTNGIQLSSSEGFRKLNWLFSIKLYVLSILWFIELCLRSSFTSTFTRQTRPNTNNIFSTCKAKPPFREV